MPEQKQSEDIRKVYTKPELTEVRLVAQEAVLGICKDANEFGGLACATCTNEPTS